MTTRRALAVYASLSLLYLFYLPHALPVLDDWFFLQRFHQAREDGLGRALTFLGPLVSNSWLGQFRVIWSSVVPLFAFSSLTDFAGWPYFLLAWTAHLLTAVLLCRVAGRLAAAPWLGFAAGGIYAVFPTANNCLFWPVSNGVYYFQTLALLWWFDRTWTRLAVERDFRYRWQDAALLSPVVFSGEQILPALVMLLPISYWLFGEREGSRPFFRYWLAHAAAVAALVGVYAVAINRAPLIRGFANRYRAAGSHWRFDLPLTYLLGSLGLKPDLWQRHIDWRPDPALIALAALAVAAVLWSLRSLDPTRGRCGRLLVWSLAGVVLAYLPVARLITFEYRYLYVPAVFLIPAAVGAAGWIHPRAGMAFALLAVLFGLASSYFEMRQCWIPQSWTARGILEAVAFARPIAPDSVLIFSGAPLMVGPAPSFITAAKWSLDSVVERYAGAARVQGARDLVVDDHDQLAVDQPDSLHSFLRENIPRLRVFVRGPGDRFAPKTLLAWPLAGGRYQLLPLPSFAGAALPSEALTMEELRNLPVFGEIYFLHRLHGHRVLAARTGQL